MNANNFIIENKVKFYTNRSDYPHQPIFNLVNNLSLTGNNYISLFRYVKNDDYSKSISEDEEAKLSILLSNDTGTYSSSGWVPITSMPIIRGSDSLTGDVTEFEDPRSSTGEPTEYNIVTAVLGNKVDVVVSFGGVSYRDMLIDGLTNIEDVNFMGTSFRPLSTGINADGVSGNSLVVQYLYNREEIGYSSLSAVTVADKSGNDINGNIIGQGAGNDFGGLSALFESGTVTGWTHGPIEGAFQMEGGYRNASAAVDPTHILSDNSTLFHNYTDWTTSGITMMAHVKFNSTGDCNVISLGSTSASLPSIFGISLRNGSLVVDTLDGDNVVNSISAGKYDDTSVEYPDATFRHTDIGKWMHLCARIDMNEKSSTSGTSLFINGERVPIYNTQKTIDEDIMNIIKVNNGSALHIGIDTSDHTLSALTGSVGITRVFNSALSDQEIFQNYICTIPTSMLIDSIKIG